jgi:hypothetical protein
MLAPDRRISRFALSTAVLFLLASTTGCGGDRHSRRATMNLVRVVVALLVDVVVRARKGSAESPTEAPPPRPEPERPHQLPRMLPPLPNPPPAPVLSWKDPPPPPVSSGETPTTFNVFTARRILDEVELGGCLADGVPRGYVRATATFEASGEISWVEIEDPRDLVKAARDCLKGRIQSARVPAFVGRPVHVAATWFVHGGTGDNRGSHP